MVKIQGLLPKSKRNAKGGTYTGRFTCPDVQWTGEGADTLATFTITAEELADAAASNMLWTDQDVQRGIQPGIYPEPPRELSLSQGYPDSKLYVFDREKADEIVEKLLRGEKLFLNPLIWNLRPGHFEAFNDQENGDLYIYSGRVYLPDSHHRHQAIVKAVDVWRQDPREYPKFSGAREFKVELYFLNRESEGDYFFDKNQLTKPTAKSKSYDLTTVDDLSLLAKRVIEKSKSLNGNVNRVTDRLAGKNPQVITLSTLREMMRTFAGDDHIDASELDGLAFVAAQFYDMLSAVRPELGLQPIQDRRRIRNELLVDAAVMMHGYAAVMKDYGASLASLGTTKKARDEWVRKITRLSSRNQYVMANWRGDFFAKRNPLWQEVGVVKRGRDGARLTVLNTGGARAECGRVLRQMLAADPLPRNVTFLAKR